MKPPICCVCGRHDDPAASLVSFANFQAPPAGMVGHPVGLEWMCSNHVKLAQALSHLHSAEAVAQLRRKGALTTLFYKVLAWLRQ